MLNERRIREIIREEITKSDEKRIKEIVADSISELFKQLYQKNNFWKSTIKNN